MLVSVSCSGEFKELPEECFGDNYFTPGLADTQGYLEFIKPFQDKYGRVINFLEFAEKNPKWKLDKEFLKKYAEHIALDLPYINKKIKKDVLTELLSVGFDPWKKGISDTAPIAMFVVAGDADSVELFLEKSSYSNSQFEELRLFAVCNRKPAMAALIDKRK
jgi:ankyrin repeat protein